ncbi:hypothetical protein [Streptomyces anandii]|uniref:hypothetical protein n=1 Tax=Streptomyces anandii TaxID=285454 RepID=UPI001677324F|nr:hypothetical protein [Streptomyces anandii]GGX65566.1 hypothetical protein GCM10010510_07010 [Streptomyces anandii JCM 4720]
MHSESVGWGTSLNPSSLLPFGGGNARGPGGTDVSEIGVGRTLIAACVLLCGWAEGVAARRKPRLLP